jgi:hypothetical protein
MRSQQVPGICRVTCVSKITGGNSTCDGLHGRWKASVPLILGKVPMSCDMHAVVLQYCHYGAGGKILVAVGHTNTYTP